ncbi:RNA polymerase subunit sigma-70 [Streptomyces sp. A7024]|uniref:RNA polymerase subunit sigma-70 n=1 Tax=Streptomyces coryli TaxID=1128680 RepID=A0A6G4TWD6_9ACTN|nr:RNA polymerase subunit sigma-70 [Streptomyces coryli]
MTARRRVAQERRRAREFESFVAGAAGRLLHAARLLTGEDGAPETPAAEQLLTIALAGTYARWGRLRGEDPYEVARSELIGRYARTAWRRRTRTAGVLARLTPQERMVLVLRLYEGVAEEQTAAALGLPPERVGAILWRACATVLAPPPPDSSAGSDSPQQPEPATP